MKPMLLSTAIALALSLGVAHADSHGSAEDLKAEIATLNDSLSRLAGERDELFNALKKAQSDNDNAADSLKSLAAARNRLFNQLKDAELNASAERERLNATINNLAADRNKLFGDYRGEQSKAAADAERMQDHILGLYDKRDALQDQLKEAQARLDAARAETASTSESLNAKISAGEEAQEGLIDQLIDLRNASDDTIAEQQAQLAELQAQVASNTATAESQEGLMDQLIDLRNSTDETVATLETRVAELEKQNRTLANVNNSAKNMMNSARESASSLESRVAELEKKNRTLTNVNASTKNLLTSARSQLDEARASAAEAQASAAAAASGSGSTAWATDVASRLQDKVGNLAGTEINAPGGDTVKIRVGNVGLFDSGGIALSENGKQVLWVIGDALEGVNNARITIEGHTDSRPVSSTSRFANNWELSFARASSALAHLRTNVGIPPERLSVAGASDKFPIASNDSAAGREQNRRVEIVVTPMQ